MDVFKIDQSLTAGLGSAPAPDTLTPEVSFDAGSEFNLSFFDGPEENSGQGFSDPGSIIRSVFEWQLEERNLEILVENFAGFLYFQGTLSKYYTSIYLEKKLLILYQRITYDWRGLQDDNEQAVLLRSWNIGRALTIFYIGYMFTACISFVTLPSVVPLMLDLILPLNESRGVNLCYYAEYFIDQQKYFIYLLLHTFICVSFTILIVTAVDSTFVSIVYHAIGLFNILEYRMRNILPFVEDYQNNKILSKEELHKYVVDSVKMHKKTIEFSRVYLLNKFSEIVQRIYNDCFFFVTVLVLICLSVGTIDLVINLNNPINLIRVGFVWLGIIMYTFFISWPGQKLINCSYDLFNTVYACGWYGCPTKTKYLIKFMMMRCTVPCRLTAGPLLTMDLVTSGNILRTALSYFTVVASFS
ncbi:hypothetical protein TSAR_008383 [Trichomalopsis sarcophagae]|uniref:Odorant receptor n=1 Tax=Trichomalopsis sarcophagae TaxID=543379 RepID=A0A232F1E7_9HYME|nr:hypothetical protein TSAR_008383 [Trichomalopsis sarcophagae]